MNTDETLEAKQFDNDLIYIENEIIAMQPQINELAEDEDEKYRYVKFSRALNAVSAINLTKKQFKNYWKTLYKNSPEKLEIILNKIDEKFEKGLISKEEMIKKIEESKDYESEKRLAIKALTGK